MHIRNHYEKTLISQNTDDILISRTSWPESIFIQYFHEDGVVSGDFSEHKEAKSRVGKTVIQKRPSSTHCYAS